MEDRDQQILPQTTTFKEHYKFLLVAGILILIFLSGTIGFLAGAKVEKNLHSQLTPTPILIPTEVPTPMYTPPISPFGVSTTPAWQPTPLRNTKDLPLIALAVIDWVLKHQPSPNPQISFTQNDGTYAQGLLSDLTQAGGEGWFAAKINGTWTVVYVGQATPRCSDIAQYHLPKDWLPCDPSL